MIELSVVIPVYNCAGCVRELHARLTASLREVTPDYEIVLVDDRSDDGAWEILRELAREDPRLRVVRLSRNFGQHAAITAGLARARGSWTVVMDCDLQEPPEEIARLYAKAQEGYDVVRATREGRRHSAFRRLSAALYRRMLSEREGGGEIEFSTLSIISRKVVDTFLLLRDRDREYQLVLDWLGFSQASITFAHAERAGDSPSSYGLRELVGVALDGMFFRTTVLLRWIVFAGFCIAALGGLMALYAVYSRYVQDTPPGYTSIVVLLLLLSGFIILALGIVGLYIGRIFDQVKGRPLFVVDEQIDGADVAERP
ncbi:MAG: polyisoprenyl-phosphate glycosyltransferase [Solirubrobacteraceae bacterium]|nr:polyisoprenyl-phosphate glycosyltransferase [Solirubrobacteraceae bacterium]